MRLVFLGTPEYAAPVLAALLKAGHQVAGVVTQPDKPAGRRRQPEAPPMKRVGRQMGIPVLQPASFRGGEAVAQVAALAPEALVVAAYGKILPPALLAVPPLGALNVHPSLLPRHRGPSPVAAAILEGDEVTGVTIMLLDEGMDTGPILAQEATPPIDPGETTETMTPRLFLQGATLLVQALEAWERGETAPRPQIEALATVSHRLTKEDGELDFHEPAPTLWRRVRAYQPWPGAYTRWEGRLIKLVATTPARAESTEPVAPGHVVGIRPGAAAALAIGTGSGVLEVQQLQMEGKRVASAQEFLRGYPGIIGARLPS